MQGPAQSRTESSPARATAVNRDVEALHDAREKATSSSTLAICLESWIFASQ